MPTILWSHGNAEDLAAAQSYLIQLQKQGFGTLIYDYPGYGLSDGKPSENGCYQNISAAWKHLTQELAIPENEIFIVGRSIGSGPSTWLAEKNNPAGLALISPFKSINRVPFTINPFPYDRFPNIKKMKNVSSKLLIIHGDQDNVIGLSHGKAIYNKHQGDKKFINAKGYGHNDILNSKQVNTALSEFFLPRNLPAR